MCIGTAPIRKEESMTRYRAFKNFFLHLWGTLTHKGWVMVYLLRFCALLLWRGVIHDFSKLSPKEFSGFVKTIHRLKDSKYGSDEYKELLAIIKPSLDLHYAKNRHHPEYHKNGLQGMGLLDLVELHYDWKSATHRHKTGNMMKSIELNRKRFNMSEDLVNILKETENG